MEFCFAYRNCIFQFPSDKLEAAFGSNYLLEIYLTVVLFYMYGFLSQETLYKFRPSKFCVLCLPSIKKLPLQEFSSNAMVQLFCQTTDESPTMEYLMFYWLSSYFKKHHLINVWQNSPPRAFVKLMVKRHNLF